MTERERIRSAIRARLAPLLRRRTSQSDVLGSYTGTPRDGGQPVQDADDL